MTLSYISPTIWSKISDMLKQTNNLNMFKLNLKEHYLKELKSSNSCQPFILKTIVCNIPSFQFICSFQIGIIPLLLRDHNVNTSNMMHVLCYTAISKSVIALSIFTNTIFLTFLIFNLVFNHFFVIFHIFFGKCTLTYHTYLNWKNLPSENPLNDITVKYCFYLIQHRNGCLAVSDIFHIFTPSIKFYIYQFSCFISPQSQSISSQFQVWKIQILLIFSWVNDFRQKY